MIRVFIIFVLLGSCAYAGTHVQTTSTSSTDNAIVRMDGTSGEIIQKSTPIIDDNGNMGIGTTKPSTIFAVGVSNSGGSLTKNAFNIDSNGNITNLGGIVANINAVTVDLSNSGGKVDFGNNANTPGGGVNIHSGAASGGYITLSPSADTEKARLDENGNFGIGTSLPAYTLDAQGIIAGYGLHTPNDIGGMTATGGIVLDPTGGGTLVTIGADRNIGIGSLTPNATLDVNGNVFLHSGNVGIGTAFPVTALELNSFVGNTTNGPKFLISRNAPEGRDTIDMYVSQYQDAFLETSATGRFQLGATSQSIALQTSLFNVIGLLTLGDEFAGDTTSWKFRHFAYLPTPAISEYVQWYLNPTTTDFELSRQNTDIRGTNIQMPLFTSNVGIGTNKTTTSALTVMSGNVGIGTWKPVNLFEVKNGNADFIGNVGVGTVLPNAALNVNGDLLVNSANGRIWGVQNLSAGHTVHFQFGGDSFNSLDTTYGAAPIINAYHGLVVQSSDLGFVIGPAVKAVTRDADQPALVAKGASSQAANIQEWQNSSGTVLDLVNSAGNIGIGSSAPGTQLDIAGVMRMVGTGAGGFRIQSSANQACTTTCTTGKALVGLDDGIIGVALPHLVGPTDATADDCLCGS